MMNKGVSEYTLNKSMRHVCADLTAAPTAMLLAINRNTITRYYN